MNRPSGRALDALRDVTLEPNPSRYAEGSCLAVFGATRVLCTASYEEKGPPWLRGSGKGWVTAEYGMLPRATHTRGRREAALGKQSGRTQEIQRLIGRSMRACVDLTALGEAQVTLDCDVLEADGGTRTAAITGAWVALALACRYLKAEGVIAREPIIDQAAAVSCGIYQGACVLDLDYAEDSAAEADANFVMTAAGGLIEVQASAEARAFSDAQFATLMSHARQGVGALCALQSAALKG